MPKLVVNPTSGNKKEISIAARVISIGRDPSNDLVLSDSMVSRRHAILEQRDDVFVLRDNGSANGTLVNGDKVDSEHTLRDGDLVAIGSARLLFQLDTPRGLGAAATDPPAEDGETSAKAASDVRNAEADKGSPSGKLRCPSCDAPALTKDRFCRKCGRGASPESRSPFVPLAVAAYSSLRSSAAIVATSYPLKTRCRRRTPPMPRSSISRTPIPTGPINPGNRVCAPRRTKSPLGSVFDLSPRSWTA